MRDKPLGHDVENIVYFRMHEELKPHFDALKADLEGKENIVAVTKAARPGAPRGCHGSRSAYMRRIMFAAPPDLYRSDVSVPAEAAAGVKKARQPQANIDCCACAMRGAIRR